MTGGPATARGGGHGWQLILADLALILFLLTLSALPAAEATGSQQRTDAEARKPADPQIDAAQALFRPVAGGPSLAAWLADQAPDPRATLTIVAVHARGGEAAAFARAQLLAAQARARGAQVRTIIMPGPLDEVYASLAYDEQVALQAT